MADVLVVAEHRDGEIRPVTGESVAAAESIADGEVHLALIAETPGELIADVNLAPVEQIHTFAGGGVFNHDVYHRVLEELAGRLEPSVILAGNTVNGLDYLPALASSSDWPIVTDAIGIERDHGSIAVTREAYGSKVELELTVDRLPCILSIRPGEWEEKTIPGDAAISELRCEVDLQTLPTNVRSHEVVELGEVDITQADVLVSVGRGIGDEEHLDVIYELAEAIDATVSASRPLVDAGWLTKDRQVGQSGKTVTPDIYIALGISGAVQHISGMKGADTIIAINTDPDAPIFDIADVGIVDDLFEVVPHLIDAFAPEDSGDR